MVQRCRSCGRVFYGWELLGGFCSRCDKLQADVMAGLKAEIEGSA